MYLYICVTYLYEIYIYICRYICRIGINNLQLFAYSKRRIDDKHTFFLNLSSRLEDWTGRLQPSGSRSDWEATIRVTNCSKGGPVQLKNDELRTACVQLQDMSSRVMSADSNLSGPRLSLSLYLLLSDRHRVRRVEAPSNLLVISKLSSCMTQSSPHQVHAQGHFYTLDIYIFINIHRYNL